MTNFAEYIRGSRCGNTLLTTPVDIKMLLFTTIVCLYLLAHGGLACKDCLCKDNGLQCKEVDKEKIICSANGTLCRHDFKKCELWCATDVNGNMVHFHCPMRVCEQQCLTPKEECGAPRVVNTRCFHEVEVIKHFGYGEVNGQWICGEFKFHRCINCHCGCCRNAF